MASFENKKLALLRIFQILEKYSDENHCLTQKDISNYLSNQYQIQIERKTVARNISLLREAGIEIIENSITIFEIQAFANSRDQAIKIVQNWEANAGTIYPKVLQMLNE